MAARAASKRVAAPEASVACMEAEPSSSTTRVPLATVGTRQNGRASASTRAASSSSWMSISRLRRSRCQGELASRSRRTISHSRVDDTSTSRRRSLSMYSTMIGTANRPSSRAAGAKKDIANHAAAYYLISPRCLK